MIMNFYNTNYHDLNSQDKIITSELFYRDIMVNLVQSMFKWDTEDTGVSSKIIELLLICNGLCVVGLNSKGEIKVGLPSESSGFDDNGDVIYKGGITVNGKEILKDVITIHNNATEMADLPLFIKVSNHLSKIDFSLDKLVQKSVCNPIPTAPDEATRQAIKKALAASGNDDIEVVLYDDWMSDGEKWKMIDFTNVANSDKFKYISSYHDDVCRRLYSLFGQSMHSPTKQAQTNDTELEGRDKISMIYPMERLTKRVEAVEEINKKFGVNWSVDFSECWKKSFEDINNNGIDDNFEDVKGGEDNDI